MADSRGDSGSTSSYRSGSSRRTNGEMRDFMGSDGGRFNKEGKYGDPPNSRLFIVCGKSITEDDFRECFSKYGTVSEVWVVKDRATGEPKGVTYIKFSKTSEAALAMEEMNGRCIGNHPRPLKVLIAHSREQGSRREQNEEERLLRLFVVVPRAMTEAELREHFQTFGDIDYVSIVKDRTTKESKGFGYVKYHRMSHAAKAYENCDRSFKPMFADPKPQKDMRNDGMMLSGPGSSVSSSGFDMMAYTPPSGKMAPLPPMEATPPAEACTRLGVVASPTLNQDQLWKLFDLVPGLDFIDLRRDRKSGQGFASVQFSSIQSAAYAKEKLHGFEYPPGHRLIVKFDPGHDIMMGQHSMMPPPPMMPRMPMMPPPQQPGGVGNGSSALSPAGAARPSGNLQTDLAHLAETIAQATSLIQAAGINPHGAGADANAGSPMSGASALPPGPTGMVMFEHYDPTYCSAKLPAAQPLAALDSTVAERLFIVCHPAPPPPYALKDVFARFGNLIDIYILNGKTCGYAKYACKESADKAIQTLHGQELCGARLKVMPAEPQDKVDTGRKRIKIDDQQF
ncbi:LOW QUALITY PROTEIN: RNA-binding protein 45-like [Pollicipes pollicipes]|uniref:LOW QUALITY PROTEIN: RNA-binding protein 45-like n=1 Tax=Pollicipes pollicipes TaxID=41117 RepID=UPI001884BE55|nr:LOW QUALITY PROTEIN: RNA-binding protein 45-like [Pollicipes pollicipes]